MRQTTSACGGLAQFGRNIARATPAMKGTSAGNSRYAATADKTKRPTLRTGRIRTATATLENAAKLPKNSAFMVQMLLLYQQSPRKKVSTLPCRKADDKLALGSIRGLKPYANRSSHGDCTSWPA